MDRFFRFDIDKPVDVSALDTGPERGFMRSCTISPNSNLSILSIPLFLKINLITLRQSVPKSIDFTNPFSSIANLLTCGFGRPSERPRPAPIYFRDQVNAPCFRKKLIDLGDKVNMPRLLFMFAFLPVSVGRLRVGHRSAT